MVRLEFLGSGNAFSDGGRCQACIHVSAPGTSLLLDCGGSALPALKGRGLAGGIDGVAISHLHGDHFGGLPYLLMEQHFAGRERPLVIGGPVDLGARLGQASRALFKDFFGAARLRYPAPTVTLGATDTEIGGAFVSALPVEHVPESHPHGFRVRVGGKLLAYSGDATWSDALLPIAKGADLFVCEASTFDRPDRVHLSYRVLMEHRRELECDRIVLTHLGADAIAHLGEIELECAEDGSVIEV